MKKVFSVLLLSLTFVLIHSCGGTKHENDHKFVGTFTNEYEDVFTLNEDMTASILFKGAKEEVKTTWYDGDDHKRPYATIEYNGDPQYYFLRDGALYRHKEDMEEGRCKITITYKEDEMK